MVAWQEPNLVGDAASTTVNVTHYFLHSLIACKVAHLPLASLIIDLLSQLPSYMMLSPSSADWSICLHATHSLSPSLKLMNPLLAHYVFFQPNWQQHCTPAMLWWMQECMPFLFFQIPSLTQSYLLTYLPTGFPRLVFHMTYLLASLLTYSPTNFDIPLLYGALACLQINYYAKEWAIACGSLSHIKYARELESKLPGSQRGRREWLTPRASTQRIVGVWWGVQAGCYMTLHQL